ncbi:MAG TPA: hypothetical protein VFS21_18445 [Roseiflexaceae bacterium]|nr:hypothetical protein [Roseiflexaceae bacterium]
MLPAKLDDLPEQIARLQAPDWLPVRLCILVVAVLIAWLSWWLDTLPATR